MRARGLCRRAHSPRLERVARKKDLPNEQTETVDSDSDSDSDNAVYCASCHGEDGKGAGPAEPGLRIAPPDLTLIRAHNKGEFPAFRITHIIDGYEVEYGHGTPDMPVWGDYFRDKERDEATITLREHNLTEYIRSIQAAVGARR